MTVTTNNLPAAAARPATGNRHKSLWLLLGLAFVFVGVGLLQWALVQPDGFSLLTFLPLPVLMACCGLVVGLVRRRFGPAAPDPILLSVTFLLSGFGLVLIARLAPAFIYRQTVWLGVATGVLLSVVLLPKNLNWLRRYKYTWLFGGLALLASTLLLGVNPSGFGARLWLQLGGGLYFQPSEPLKLLLVVFLAGYLADRRHRLIEARAYIGRLPLPHPAYLGPMLLMWGFSVVLLVWQRDLGAALLFFGTFLGMLYAATGQYRYLGAGALLLGAAGALGYFLFDVVRLRVDGFLDPWADPSGRSFQIVQSLLAFASGGVLGEGLGQGLPTAIPVVHTDFVYAAIGEEYGLLGALAILLCFALLIGRAFRIAQRAATDFEQLLAAGIATVLGLQTIVITAGTLKLMPLTGVTLPLVSYGGSSMIISFVMIGLLLFIDANRPAEAAPPVLHPIYHLSLARGLFTGLLIVAGGLILWQVVLSPFLVTRPDNPRQVVTEQRIDRGRLLTRDGVPIAETIIGPNQVARRHYPYPNLASVTGYYSLRYGVGGAEAVFDPILRGEVDLSRQEEFTNELLHRAQVGQDVTLAVDLPAQVAADVALAGREGALVVVDLESGAVRVMAGYPTYDPNTLDEMWDTLRQDAQAPLLNRATQGLFPLGELSRLVSLIGLHEAGATIPPQPLTVSPKMLAQPLGPLGYRATARQLGLDQPLPGVRSQAGLLPLFPPEGQGSVLDLSATPLHLARVIAAVERDGAAPRLTLALSEQPPSTPVIDAATAQAVRASLPQLADEIVGLTGIATPEETGQAYLSWFVGLAPAQAATQETPRSAALDEDGNLIFDPSQITPATPQPPAAPPESTARYAVAAVVVTQTPQAGAALDIANNVLAVLLESGN